MLFKDFFNESKNLKVSYSAIVLDDTSRDALLSSPEIQKYLNPDHEIIAHHMTIKMGSLENTIYENEEGSKETITATHIGISNDGNVIAVKVNGYSANQIPHVTISINRKENAKPRDSNNIKNWKQLASPIKLTGTIEQIRH
jgi:hypothetical protein